MVMGFPLVDSNGCDLDADLFEKALFAYLANFESLLLALQVIAEG
jgi:hypothetical protein